MSPMSTRPFVVVPKRSDQPLTPDLTQPLLQELGGITIPVRLGALVLFPPPGTYPCCAGSGLKNIPSTCSNLPLSGSLNPGISNCNSKPRAEIRSSI
jgi:hypothetical protein